MTTFDSAGYEDLRQAVLDRWTHVAIVNGNGNEETRIEIAADARTQWTNTASSNPITLSVTIQGSDSDISTPTTVLRAELYKSSTATSRLSHDSVSSPQPTLEAPNDEVTLTIDVEEPDV